MYLKTKNKKKQKKTKKIIIKAGCDTLGLRGSSPPKAGDVFLQRMAKIHVW
jgi:hypothetical protein